MYAASLSDSLTNYDFLHSHFNLLTKRHIFHLTGAPSFFFFFFFSALTVSSPFPFLQMSCIPRHGPVTSL